LKYSEATSDNDVSWPAAIPRRNHDPNLFPAGGMACILTIFFTSAPPSRPLLPIPAEGI